MKVSYLQRSKFDKENSIVSILLNNTVYWLHETLARPFDYSKPFYEDFFKRNFGGKFHILGNSLILIKNMRQLFEFRYYILAEKKLQTKNFLQISIRFVNRAFSSDLPPYNKFVCLFSGNKTLFFQ